MLVSKDALNYALSEVRRTHIDAGSKNWNKSLNIQPSFWGKVGYGDPFLVEDLKARTDILSSHACVYICI